MVTINNISEASRIIIKVGSSRITSKDGNINEKILDSIANDLLKLREQNKEIIIVSSGAVSLGNEINKDSMSQLKTSNRYDNEKKEDIEDEDEAIKIEMNDHVEIDLNKNQSYSKSNSEWFEPMPKD